MGQLLEHEGGTFNELLSLRPALQQKYLAFLSAIEKEDSLPERVFTLCRARIEQIHGCNPIGITEEEAEALSKGNFVAFSEGEQAALVAAEKIPFQHHALIDEEVDAMKSAFGNSGTVSLLTALSFFDVTCRLNQSFSLGNS